MVNPNSDDILEKTPWAAEGIEFDTPLDQYEWGYLIIYKDNRTVFTTAETPSRAEIFDRWGHYLNAE